MKFVQLLKEVFKATIRSGKIFYVEAIKETYTKDKIPAVDLLTLNSGSYQGEMKDVLEVTLHVRDIIMMILFAKEIYKVGINLFKILNGIFYKKKKRISS